MEHDERYYLMMMDALDGTLPDEARDTLQGHLRDCTACGREWQALLAIDMLFRQTPLLLPAVNFAERTLARLPDRRVRVWALGGIYSLLLLSGIVPILLGIFLLGRYAPILQQPALVERVFTSLGALGRVVVTVIDALLAGGGRFVAEQPAIVGWLIVLAGLVLLWGGVFQRLLAQPVAVGSRNEV